MIKQAKVLRVNEDVEEEVVLKIGNVELTCFACLCPYVIEVGHLYPVELYLMVFNDYDVTELADDSSSSIIRLGNSFASIVMGKLRGACLEAGEVVFEDDVLQRDFGYLDGKMVAIKADRIDAEFREV